MPWDLTQFSQSPSAALLCFHKSHQWSEISFLSKVILVLGKARSCGAPNLSCSGAGTPRWFDVSQKNCTRRDAWARAFMMKLSVTVAYSCSLLNLYNFHREMFKLNAKFYTDSLFYLLNHFECDGHTVYMLTHQHLPPPLASTVKSSLFTHSYSRPLSLAARLHPCHSNSSCYINNGWTFYRQTS